VLQAEKEVPPEEDEDRGKAALTELFNEVKTAETPIMVERVVADIDEIVRLVRFPGWQGTQAGEREVKKALRKALFKYKLHADEETVLLSQKEISFNLTTQSPKICSTRARLQNHGSGRPRCSTRGVREGDIHIHCLHHSLLRPSCSSWSRQ
jgi:hypothetical protein